jgi:hypothetical protein
MAKRESLIGFPVFFGPRAQICANHQRSRFYFMSARLNLRRPQAIL